MKLIRHIEFEDPPSKIRFSHDGSRLWVNTRDEISETHLHQSGHTRVQPDFYAFDMAFLNDEQIIATTQASFRKHRLVIYDIHQQHIVAQANVNDVRSVCVDYHRKRIFAGTITGRFSEDSVGVYNISGHLERTFKVGDMPLKMALSHSGDKLAIAGIGFEVWDVADEPRRISPEIPTNRDCTGTLCEADSVDITPDGKYAVAGFHGVKRLCVVVDTTNGDIIGWFGPEGDEINIYYTADVAISPDGKHVAVASPDFPTVPVYRVADGSIAHLFPINPCGAVAFSPKGNILAMGDTNSVSLWQFTL